MVDERESWSIISVRLKAESPSENDLRVRAMAGKMFPLASRRHPSNT